MTQHPSNYRPIGVHYIYACSHRRFVPQRVSYICVSCIAFPLFIHLLILLTFLTGKEKFWNYVFWLWGSFVLYKGYFCVPLILFGFNVVLSLFCLKKALAHHCPTNEGCVVQVKDAVISVTVDYAHARLLIPKPSSVQI